MGGKIPSEIIRIDLNEKSYKDTHVHIEPTYVNFFFGNNGAGKSTIAKAIQNSEGVTYVSGRSATDYLPLVYNQEFIDENMRNYRNMRGVFTLNAKNAEIQQQIEEQSELRTIAKRGLSEATEKRDKKRLAKDKLRTDFFKDCWKRAQSVREEFSQTQAGKGKSEPFAKEVMKATPKEVNIEELRRLYGSAYSVAKRYEMFATIADVSVLDTLEGRDILSVAIVNSSDTDLAQLLKKIGATQWVQQGHTDFAEQADGKCPYCGRELPEDFEETFTRSFDAQYQENRARLNAFLEAYKKTANELFIPLQQIPNEIYSKIDVKTYQDKLAVLKAAIQANIDIIKGKVDNPAIVVELNEIAPVLQELSDIITGYNALIKENNDVVDAGPKKRAECVELVFSMLAYQLQDLISAYKKSDEDMQVEIDVFEKAIEKYTAELNTIKEKLKALRSNTVETETAKESINTMLRDSGMPGLSLQAKKGVENVYEVQRADGTIAENLSEGEKNFIAFLYFYHLVYGSDSEEGETRDKIVVIDDPVSSMDSGSLFIVSTLVRQMIEICRNNADNRNPTAKGNFIKQIFILTHNSYFHREISYSYVSKYDYVSFYLIRKCNLKSSVQLCDAVNPGVPTERINVNPVKNSYAALWDEYKEIKSAVPLLNVIRRILEYYFLQLCGYEGAHLRDVVLVKAKNDGKYKNLDGTDSDEKYQLAASMLAYINANAIGMNDGMDFVDNCTSAEDCRAIFEMIFTVMGQKQHYDMMIGNQ